MKLSPVKLSLAMTIAVLACSRLGAADTVVSNYNGSNTSRDQIGGGFASAFTVGDNDALLDSVSLFFKVSSPDTSFTVNIFSDSSGMIGNLHCSSTLTGLTTGSQLLTFSSFTGTTSLDASTTYWLAIQADGNSSSTSGWYDAGISSTSNYGWTINDTPKYYSSSVWSDALSSTPQQFTITATAVPEPSEYAAMMGLAGIGVLALRRRKNK